MTVEGGSILVVGNPGALDAVVATISQRGYATRLATSPSEALAIHREEGADLVLLLLPLVGLSAARFVADLRAQDPRVTLVVTGLDADVRGAPDALSLGAREYVADPVGDPGELLFVIGVTLGARRSDALLRYLRKKDAAGAELETLTGECPAMRQVLATVKMVCHRTASGGTPIILITGETGTGKGLVAKCIHYNSVRRSGAFVDVNCAAIPGSLMESELFGYERGAFTDARAGRPGLFEAADGGTLFFDEIGSLPLDLQGKLLTSIEEKKFRRIGGRESIRVDVQVIAATHRDLAAMMRLGEFREDLFHRLNVVALELPPLRERGSDQLLLAESFLASMCRDYGLPPKRFSSEAARAIGRYAWPGNVRELRNQIERIVLLEDVEVIQPEHLRLAPEARPDAARATRVEPVRVEADAGRGLRIELPAGGVNLELLEREVLRGALERCAGNVSAAARFLQISRQTLIYRMKKYDLAGDEDA